MLQWWSQCPINSIRLKHSSSIRESPCGNTGTCAALDIVAIDVPWLFDELCEAPTLPVVQHKGASPPLDTGLPLPPQPFP